MDAIYIPQLLQAPQKTETRQVQDWIKGLETLTPVRGVITVTHQGTYLEVKGVAEAIVTLTCHRCLQNYNERLQVDTNELIWLEEGFQLDRPLEQDIEDLSETLPPRGYFDPSLWLYEQLSLALPLQQLCGSNCPGIPLNPSLNPPILDRRWAALEALKDQLS